ncbi:hypothetical protein EXS74_02295 [Candidatus Woesearchaeota archaeon]|nr:hypothetical protein [Candidatus Woesearchaeota archaeon]
MRIGIISDVHAQPQLVRKGIARLRDLGAERLIVNGDIGTHMELLEDSQRYTAEILGAIGESGLESYVQPGSHESIAAYGSMIDIVSGRYRNIIDMLRTPSVDLAGYRLLFLPGSDSLSGGEYTFGAEVPTGRYALTETELVPVKDWNTLSRLQAEERFQGEIHYTNLRDFVPFVENPEKTILVCHVPARFDVGAQGVDFAYFATDREGSIIPGQHLEAQIIHAVREREGKLASAEEIARIAQVHGFTLRKENVGNVLLRKFLEDMQIPYAVNGHIHESGHHAHDREGNAVPQKKSLPELFWNSGCFDRKQMGILTLADEGVAYQNVLF